MDISRKIISIVVWTLIGLCILMMVLPEIPWVQNACGNRVAAILSEKLGTEVTVEKIALELPNRAVVDNIVMLDQKGDTLLTTGRMSAKVELMPLIKDGKIIIHSAQLFTPNIRLKEYRNGKNNYQFVLDSLASKDTTGAPLYLKINDFVLRDGAVSMTRPHELLEAEGINGYFTLHELNDENIDAEIYELAFVGRHVKRQGARGSSLIDLKNLSTRFRKQGSQMTLDDMVLTLANSELKIKKAEYNTDRKTYNAIIEPSKISTIDIGNILGKKTEWEQTMNISGKAIGNSNMIRVPYIDIYSDNGNNRLHGTDIMASFNGNTAKGTIDDIRLSNDVLKMLNVPVLDKLQYVSFNGKAEKVNDWMNVMGLVKTDIGNAIINGKMNGKDFEAKMNTTGLNLTYLSGMSGLGFVSGKIAARGNMKTKNVGGVAEINRLDYNNYSYRNINIDGSYRNDIVQGSLNIADPQCSLAMKGTADIRKKALVLNGDVNKFIYNGVALDGHIDADVMSSGKNDLEGSINVSNEYANININGRFGYTALYDDIQYAVKSRIPSVTALSMPQNVEGHKYDFSVNITDTKTLENLLKLPIRIDGGLNLQGMVDNSVHLLNVNGEIPHFVYGNKKFDDCTFFITTSQRINDNDNDNDTLRYDTFHYDTFHYDNDITAKPYNSIQVLVNAKKMEDDGGVYDINISTQATDDILLTKLTWYNPTDNDFNGNIDTKTKFFHGNNGKTGLQTEIRPSDIIFNDSVFHISSGIIEYADRRMKVKNVGISNSHQHIRLDGVASDYEEDSLTVDLQDVNVEYVMEVVGFDDVDFRGRASGRANIKSMFNNPSAFAQLKVKKFQFEHGDLGTLNVTALWNKDEEQIDIDGMCDDGTGKLKIDGFVSPSKYNIDLKLQLHKTAMGYLNTFTSNVLKDIKGRANGHLNVIGPLNAIQLVGAVKAKATFSVPILNTQYRLSDEDSVYFVPDDIQFKNTKIYDIENNMAVVNGGVHHKTLGRFTFDLDINTEKLLCFDKKDFGDESFFGTIYASGNTKIHNIRGETNIEGNMTPLSGSSFVYNASRENYINTQKFITFRDVTKVKGQRTKDEEQNSSSTLDLKPQTTNLKQQTSDLYVNFTIDANPNLRLSLLTDSKSDDYINLFGDGTLKATYYNKGTLDIFGAYTVDHGDYRMTIQNLMKKKFQFEKGGTVMFVGNPFDAAVNLTALYTINNVALSDLNIGNSFGSNTVKVNCIMNITGISGNPKVSFDLDLPNVNSDEKQMIRSLINSEEDMNQQVIYLLGIGRFYTKGENNAEQSQTSRSQTELAMQSILSGTISAQLNNMLTKMIHNNDWNVGANISTGDEGWMNAIYEGTISGRMFNNRLLMNGQFGYRDNINAANTTFVGDFDIQYLLTPNGNLSVKAYNQSNDRYFTKSSYQTQGISFVMKKDFRKFKDLFKKKNKKKKSKKKTNSKE
ncbi:MAG: translocation/assembly module TamB domain-containing protein [Prevotella sp.]|nr:translocation/assembly module TamB domain-containing protein [Candidatus Equicola stercoris]